MDLPLGSTRDQGIPGVNYYFVNRDRWNITPEELAAVGIVDDQCYVHPDLITPLQMAIQWLKAHSLSICIKDAYRSAATYALVRAKVAAQRGEEETARLFNMDDMPHATGRAVDVGLVDLLTSQEVWLRNRQADGPDADFLDFYEGKDGERAMAYRRRQKLLHQAMQHAGFVFGSKREVWHFELPE